MNPPPPEDQASSSSSSESRHKRQPDESKLVEQWLICKRTRRPSILASSPTPPANDEIESSCNRDDSNDGSGQWRPWADIATPLLDVLLPRVSLRERIRLSFVCRPWHDFLADCLSLCRPRFPWLMNQGAAGSDHNFYSPSDDDYYCLHLANTKNKFCVAASHGWLLFLDFDSGMHEFRGLFVDPLSKARVDLPTCPLFLHHAIFSAAPTEPSCVVLGLSCVSRGTWYICYCSIRDKTWHTEREGFLLKSNIAFMGGKFYFLSEKGLAELDFSRCHPLKWLKLNDDTLVGWDGLVNNLRKPLRKDFEYMWLMESNGELLIVALLEKEEVKDAAFVYSADFVNKIWVKVEDLGDRSLFLSLGACFSLPAVDANEYIGGCIYLSNYCTHGYAESPSLWYEYTVCRQSSNYGRLGEICVWRSPQSMSRHSFSYGRHGEFLFCLSPHSIWLIPSV